MLKLLSRHALHTLVDWCRPGLQISIPHRQAAQVQWLQARHALQISWFASVLKLCKQTMQHALSISMAVITFSVALVASCVIFSANAHTSSHTCFVCFVHMLHEHHIFTAETLEDTVLYKGCK